MPYNFFLQGEEGFIALPVPCFLIDHPKGTAVFDTGLEPALQTDDEEKRKKALGIVESFAKHEFLPGENIAERLTAFGYDPDKIDFIINSHLHIDHCGGNELIKNARLVVQKREWEAGSRALTYLINTIWAMIAWRLMVSTTCLVMDVLYCYQRMAIHRGTNRSGSDLMTAI